MISLAMIVKDEADTIGDILDAAAQFCDELIVVDTGSTDDTIDIVELHDANIVFFDWCDDFAAARNFALDQVDTEWAFWVDGGDTIPQTTVDGIKELDWSGYDGVMMDYVMQTAGQTVLRYPRERIFQPDKRWVGKAHECVALSNPLRTNLEILTEPSQGPRISKAILEGQRLLGDMAPRDLFYLARERFWEGEWARASMVYQEWLATGPCDWEKYTGYLDMAVCDQQMGQSGKFALFQAAYLIPTRAEAWALLGEPLYARKQYAQAAPFYSAACQAIRPSDGFIVDEWYGWLPWDRWATCLGWTDRIEQAKDITERVLIPALPGDGRLEANMNFYREHL